MMPYSKMVGVLVAIAVVAVIACSFNYHPVPVQAPGSDMLKIGNPAASAISGLTTISPTSGWVCPTTTFTLTPPSGTVSSVAWTDASQKNDMDFAGGTNGNAVTTITNWTSNDGSSTSTNLATWPQTNSWSNYSSTNTGSGYNKVGLAVADNSASNSFYAYYVTPGYQPTANSFFYINFEIRPMITTYPLAITMMNSGHTTNGTIFMLNSNGTFGINKQYSNSISGKTNVAYAASNDYFIRIYFNPSTYKEYWALNGTVYNNGGSYWNWQNNAVADMVSLNINGYTTSRYTSGTIAYFDNLDFSWQYTFPASSWTSVSSPYTFTLGTGLTDGSTVTIGYNTTISGYSAGFTAISTYSYDKSAPAVSMHYYPIGTVYNASSPYTKIFVTTSTTFKIESADSESGVKATNYKLWKNSTSTEITSWTAWASFTLSGQTNGTFTICYDSWDNAGNNNSLQYQIVYLDATAPTPTISPAGIYNSTLNGRSVGWISTSSTITISGTDNTGGSGIAGGGYKVATVTGTSYTKAWSMFTTSTGITIPGNGTYQIFYDAIDNAGNNATELSYVIRVDNLAPTPTCTPSGMYNATLNGRSVGWITGTTSITISGTDNTGGSGIGTSSGGGYKIITQSGTTHNVAWTTWSGAASTSFTINANGTYQVLYDCYDDVGVNGTELSYQIRVDTVAPTPTVTYSSIYNATTTKGYILPSATITLAAVDNTGGSGSLGIGYKIAGIAGTSFTKAYGTYSAPFSISNNGTYQIIWSYWDNAINNATSSFIIRVDVIAPTPTITYSSIYNATTTKGYILPSATITLAAADNTGGSGFLAIGYKIAGIAGTSFTKAYGTYSAPFSISNNGTYQIIWSYWDNVINNATSSFIIRVDAIALTPTVTYSSIYNATTTKGYILPSATITLAATDNTGGSGFLGIGYKIAGIAGTSFSKAYGIYSVPFSISSNGTYQVIWSTWDNCLNNATQSFIIRVDAIAPTPNTVVYSPIIYNATTKGYILPSATITLAAVDNIGGSGFLAIGYKIVGIAGTSFTKAYGTYSSPFSISSNGTYQVIWSYWDNLVNNGTSSFIIRVDAIAPTPNAVAYSPTIYNTTTTKGYILPSATITLAATDNTGGSGFLAIGYKIAGIAGTSFTKAYGTYSSPFSISSNGTYQVIWSTWDNCLNNATQSFIIRVDAIAPTPNTVVYSPTIYNVTTTKGYILPSATITLAAVDNIGGSGFLAIGYKIVGIAGTSFTKAYGIYSAPFNIASNGTYHVIWSYWDNCLNNATQSFIIRVDAIAPTPNTVVYSPTIYNATTTKGYILPSATITLAAVDNTGGSGFLAIGYKIVGIAGTSFTKAYGTYSSPFSISSNGTYQVIWSTWDNCLNNATQSFIIRVDAIAPTTTMTQPTYVYNLSTKNYTTGSAIFTLAATDNAGGSGVKTTSYQITANGVAGSWTICTGTFTLGSSTNGTYTIAWNSTDNVGNIEGTHHLTVYIDAIATTTTMTQPTYVHNSGTKNYTTGSGTFTLTVTDNAGGSGVASTSYRITVNGVAGSWTIYTGAFMLGSSANGTYTIAWSSTDNAGNVEGTHHLTVYIDTIAPATTMTQPSYVHNSGTKNYTTGSATFTLVATDNAGGSGVASTKYQITANGVVGSWTTYTGAFILGSSANGTYTIAWYSTDNVNNAESIHHLTIYIDMIAPATTMTQPAYVYMQAVPYTKNFTTGSDSFTLAATDNAGGSGIANTSYQITANGMTGSWMTYNVPFTLGSTANGTYTIAWYCTDNAGNVEGTHHLTVYIDAVTPATMMTQPAYVYTQTVPYTKNFTTGSGTFILAAADNTGGSGVASTNYQIAANGVAGSWTIYTGAFMLGSSTNGTYMITWYSTDNAGNGEGMHHLTVYIDAIAPATTMTQPTYVYNTGTKNFTSGSATFTLTAMDNAGGSAIKTTSYQITANGVAGSWTTYTGTFTLGSPANGTYTIAWYSTDNVNNTEGIHHLTVYIDTIMSMTTMTQPAYVYTQAVPYTKNYTTGSAMFTLVATDNAGGSGIKITSYQITTNGVAGSWMTYNAPFTLGSLANGTYTIAWYSTDNAGNMEGTQHLTVYIDAVTPATMMAQPAYIYNSGTKNYTTGSATFTLAATDNTGGSGVASTKYQITANGVPGSLTTYNGAFMLGSSANGTYMISWYSTDRAGNNEGTHHLTVYIDAITPATTMIQPTYIYKATTPYTKNYTTGSTTFTLIATDTGGSGTKTTSYRITANGVAGSWTYYTGAFMLGSPENGTYMIAWYSTDNVNNVEGIHHLTVYIDTIAVATTMTQPVYTCTKTVPYTKNYTIGSATFTLTATDNAGGSGVASTSYQITANSVAGSWTTFITPFTLGSSVNGTYTIAWNSTDNAGNIEGTHHLTVYIDAIAPTTAMTQPSYIYNSGTKNFTTGSATFALAATDNAGGSSIKITNYRITANGVAGSLLTYNIPFMLGSSANGTYVIAWYSTDNAGNVEGTHHLTVYIDTIAATPNAVIYSAIYNATTMKGYILLSATITLAATDNAGGSGLAGIGYKIAGIAGTSFAKAYGTYTAPFSITSNGTYQVIWSYWDNVANNATLSFIIRVDAIAPTTTMTQPTYVYNSGTKNYTTGSATFTLAATDNAGGSSVKTTNYRITANGVAGSWMAYTNAFMLGSPANGTYTIAWYSTDNAGNVEGMHHLTVYIDTIAATPNAVTYSAIFNATMTKGYILPSATITLAATDNAGGSGLAGIGYKIAGIAGTIFAKAYGTYTAPFSITSNGTYQVIWSYWDNVANNATLSFIIRVDAIAPTTTMTQPTYVYNSGTKNYTTGSATFTLAATDNAGGSSVKTTNYRITTNGVAGSWTICTGAFTLGSSANGTYTITWYSTDNAGNVDGMYHLTVYIDAIAPTTTMTQPSYVYTTTAPYTKNYTTGSAIFTLTSSDNTGGSDIASTKYQITANGVAGSWTTGTGTFTLGSSANGTYKIAWYSTDNAGNMEGTHHLTVFLDSIPPTTTITNNGTAVNSTFYNMIIKTSFTIGAIDSGSGVFSTNLTITGPLPATARHSWLFNPGNDTFSFYALKIMIAGEYNVTWYSIDHIGNMEANHSIIVNFTRAITISMKSFFQPEYNYLSTNDTVYYGENVTATLSLVDDLGQSINGATVLDIIVNGQQFTNFTQTGAGLYNITINMSTINAGMYGMAITAKKTCLSNNTIQFTLVILAIPVKITILSMLQGTSELQPDALGVHVGNSLTNLTVRVAVTNSLDNTPMMLGNLAMIYRNGANILFNKSVSDTDDGVADGIYTIVMPKTVVEQLVNTDAFLKLQWIAPSLNYNDTNASTEFSVRFNLESPNIFWLGVAIILILLALIAVIYNVVLRKVVKPRRLQRHNYLSKISSALEDATNIQSMFIINKASGTCLFYKTYGKSSLDPSAATLDPEFISSFLTVFQSFGAMISGNKALEELKWQDYQILLGEGNFVQVAMVLASKASEILKSRIPQFVEKFETTYKDELANGNSDPTAFKDSAKIINDMFDTSITLPHTISSMLISPKSALEKKILDASIVLTKDREYFFIATLLAEIIEKTKLSYSEVFAAIQELRKQNILLPIDFESIKKKREIAQQEVTNVQEGIKNKAEAMSHKDEALNKIKNNDKDARYYLKNYDYENAIKLYEESEAMAAKWDLKSMIPEITHNKIDASIKNIQYKIAVVLNDARSAEKQGKNTTAIQKYTEAADLSSSLFTLGVLTEKKKMNEYIKKVKELKKTESWTRMGT